MNNKLFEIVCAKDENAARMAAAKIFNECNIEEFEKLCEKMDFLFDFVKENVLKRFSIAVNSSNFKNIFKFFNCYSPHFDDFFAVLTMFIVCGRRHYSRRLASQRAACCAGNFRSSRNRGIQDQAWIDHLLHTV